MPTACPARNFVADTYDRMDLQVLCWQCEKLQLGACTVARQGARPRPHDSADHITDSELNVAIDHVQEVPTMRLQTGERASVCLCALKSRVYIWPVRSLTRKGKELIPCICGVMYVWGRCTQAGSRDRQISTALLTPVLLQHVRGMNLICCIMMAWIFTAMMLTCCTHPHAHTVQHSEWLCEHSHSK